MNERDLTFRNVGEGRVMICSDSGEAILLQPGGEHRTRDPVEIATLRGIPTVKEITDEGAGGE